ncbi:unnamed protein product [Arabis nemorensis]|uniref:F-box domain-containing protein n=1 Tax=Arabis nemorensis TaxID=586526 RepID=A0A565BUZ6_9BRAS|nr:unnamed protein product [Arabis nemorensis]
MDRLPGHLIDKILLGTDPKSLWKMRCTNRSLQSHICDPWFESEYFSRRSGLLHVSSYGSNMLCYHTLGDSRSVRKTKTLMECQILDSCSGLLLLYFINGTTQRSLCIVNPLTKKFRFLNLSTFMRLARVCKRKRVVSPSPLGFAVNQTTRSFKIIHINRKTEVENPGKSSYRFEINSGNSWRYSKTTITSCPSNFSTLMKKPVYLDGSLHWLRNDGSIVAFNPETEQARLIPVEFPQELHSRTLFAAGESNLTLISATEEVIYVYALEDILSDLKWVLVKQIKNGVLDGKRPGYWNVEAYDGKCLVLSEGRRKIQYGADRMVHVYDLSANKWLVKSSIPGWCDANQDIFQFTPSSYSVVGLSAEILACDDNLISSLRSIMGLIDGISSEKVEKHFRKRSLEEEEENKLVLLKKMKPS